MSASQELEKAATAFALDAVRLDKNGAKGKAITLYQKAIESLLQLVQLYPEYGLNKVYIQRAIAYQERIKALQGAFSPADMQMDVEPKGSTGEKTTGCGKTLIAAAVATELDATFYSIDAASIMSKWLGEAEQNVAKVFGSARKSSNEGKPAIVFVDELDSLMGQHSNEVGGEIRVRNQFLKEMDGI